MFWKLISLAAGFIAGYEAANWLMALRERRALVRLARALAGVKPLLVVGNPRGRHETGTLCIDMNPDQGCMQGNVEDLSCIPTGFFGAAFVGHVLEHVENPARAWGELKRVADHVVVAYPYPSTLIAWFHPDHRWIILRADEQIEFMANPVFEFITSASSTRPRLSAPLSTRRD